MKLSINEGSVVLWFCVSQKYKDKFLAIRSNKLLKTILCIENENIKLASKKAGFYEGIIINRRFAKSPGKTITSIIVDKELWKGRKDSSGNMREAVPRPLE